MFPVNPSGNQNYALSHRRSLHASSENNPGVSQSDKTTTAADNISFSTATVGMMTLHVGKIITTLSEYEKLLLSIVLAPDTEKKPCSSLPDRNGIYSWMVDVSRHAPPHLVHYAPDQVMVTSALDSSFSCIERIIISELSPRDGQLHCDTSFDWAANNYPEVSGKLELKHPGQVNAQQLAYMKEAIIGQTAMMPEGQQPLDIAVQHQLTDPLLLDPGLAENINTAAFQPVSQNQPDDVADHQWLAAESQQAGEFINWFAESFNPAEFQPVGQNQSDGAVDHQWLAAESQQAGEFINWFAESFNPAEFQPVGQNQSDGAVDHQWLPAYNQQAGELNTGLSESIINTAAFQPASQNQPDGVADHQWYAADNQQAGEFINWFAESFNPAEFQPADQNQPDGVADHQWHAADNQQAGESINWFAETSSYHNVNPDINNHHITPQEVPYQTSSESTEGSSLDDKSTGSSNLSQPSTALSFLSDSVAGKSKVSKRKRATKEEIDLHIELMFKEGKTKYQQIRESLNSVSRGVSDQRIRERQAEFYKKNKIEIKLPKASDATVIEHINKVSGRSVDAVLESVRKEKLSINKERAAGLLYEWRESNTVEASHSGIRRKDASKQQIMQHIVKVAATRRPIIRNVINSLHEANLGATSRSISPLIRAYLQQQENKKNSSE